LDYLIINCTFVQGGKFCWSRNALAYWKRKEKKKRKEKRKMEAFIMYSFKVLSICLFDVVWFILFQEIGRSDLTAEA
jgi:hypothetical protein